MLSPRQASRQRRHITVLQLCNSKMNEILKFPQTSPGLGNPTNSKPTNSGTFSGNLNWFMKSWVWYGLYLILQYLLHPRQAQNKTYAILRFPQTYPSLETATDSGTFAGLRVMSWEYFKSWFSYGLFVLNCCGVVVDVAVVFNIVKKQWGPKDVQC